MSRIDGIKSRLGSIAPLRAYQAGGAIERIIKHDMPALIKIAEAAQTMLKYWDDIYEIKIEDADRLRVALEALGTKGES